MIPRFPIILLIISLACGVAATLSSNPQVPELRTLSNTRSDNDQLLPDQVPEIRTLSNTHSANDQRLADRMRVVEMWTLSNTRSDNDQRLADRMQVVEMWSSRSNAGDDMLKSLLSEPSSPNPDGHNYIIYVFIIVSVSLFILVVKITFILILFRCLHKTSKNIEKFLCSRKREKMSSNEYV